MPRNRNQGRDEQGHFTPGSEAARKAGRKGGKESSSSRGSRSGGR